MKISIASLSGFAALACAQGIPNFPACGSGIMLPAISATGCGFTNPTCLCKNQSFKDALNKIPKLCTSPADVKFYADFINGQCSGQPGFPLTLGASVAEVAEPSPSSASPSKASAAPTVVAPATPASAAQENKATSAGSTKPATFTGSAASCNMADVVSAGMAALAIGFAGLSF